MNIQHKINDNKQFQHKFIEQLIQFNVVHQEISLLQVHEQVMMSQTLFIFVVQRGSILFFIFDGMASVIDILIERLMEASILYVLTVIDF